VRLPTSGLKAVNVTFLLSLPHGRRQAAAKFKFKSKIYVTFPFSSSRLKKAAKHTFRRLCGTIK
jgi:hypothetical protein